MKEQGWTWGFLERVSPEAALCANLHEVSIMRILNKQYACQIMHSIINDLYESDL